MKHVHNNPVTRPWHAQSLLFLGGRKYALAMLDTFKVVHYRIMMLGNQEAGVALGCCLLQIAIGALSVCKQNVTTIHATNVITIDEKYALPGKSSLHERQ